MPESSPSQREQEFNPSGEVNRDIGIQEMETPWIEDIQVLRGTWLRKIPPQYANSQYCGKRVHINFIIPEKGHLVVPHNPDTTLATAFQHSVEDITSPSSMAKSVTTGTDSLIQRLLHQYPDNFPDSAQFWPMLSKEIADDDQNNHTHHCDLILTFQANGLWFNRGSYFYTEKTGLIGHPGMDVASRLPSASPEQRFLMGATEQSIRRPLLFIGVNDKNKHVPILFHFLPQEAYTDGLLRLEKEMQEKHITNAFSASPPLIIPDANGEPQYISLSEALTDWHANDVRHYVKLPYSKVPLLLPELARMQGLDPKPIVQSLTGKEEDRVAIRLKETVSSRDALQKVLDEQGYKGRYSFDDNDPTLLRINLLESVYSLLIPCVTKTGKIVIIQTNGMHNNITGQDGPTFTQMVNILKDANMQPPFDSDPIITALSGAQGNDVPDIYVKTQYGDKNGTIFKIIPQTGFSTDAVTERGPFTTPRVGIVQ